MKIKPFLCLLAWIALAIPAWSQNHYGPELRKILDPRSSDGWLYFTENTDLRPEAFFLIYRDDLHLDASDEMRLVKKNEDEQGFTHYFFQQYHSGVRVAEAEFFVHVNAKGQLYSANGKIVENLRVSTFPAVSPAQALTYAQASMGARTYMWESEFWEKDLRRRKGSEQATYRPKPELVITGKQPHLAYSIDLYSADPLDEKRYRVDAKTGEILQVLPLSSECNPTSLNTIFNGSRNISTDKFASSPDNYRTHDDCASGEINVRDWNSSTLSSSPVDITSSNNTWNNNNNQTFAGTVLWATEQAAAYYQSTFSRNSYDGSGGDVDGFINAQFDDGNGNPYSDNASMSFSSGKLKVGLGSAGTLSNSWSALDILGHEYTHAVTGSEASLDYSGESGALNESFSDIFGEMVTTFVTGNCDYLEGNDRSSGAIRNFINPNLKSDPSTYLGTFWKSTSGTCDATNDNCGVHTNSGVQNHWFYLLAEGGSGTNDNGDSYTVTGIGKTDAARIAYKNLTDILTSTSDYPAARSGSIMAANMLFGDCSAQTQQVINAWNAVGVYNTTGFDCGCSTNVVRGGTESNGTYESSNWIRATSVITTGSNVTYDAEKTVKLLPGFHAQAGSRFHALIDGCFGVSFKPDPAPVDRADNLLKKETKQEQQAIAQELAIYLAPNPADNEIQVSFQLPENQGAYLSLFNMQGKRLVSWSQEPGAASTGQRIDVSQFTPGFYLCVLECGKQRVVQKFLINR